MKAGDIVVWTGVLNDPSDRMYLNSILRLKSVSGDSYEAIILSSPERPDRVGKMLRGQLGNLALTTNRIAKTMLKVK